MKNLASYRTKDEAADVIQSSRNHDSAFPQSMEATFGFQGEKIINYKFGLTKRELFAAMAMQGLFSCGEHRYGSSPEGLSQYAVSIADALINELNENETD